MLCSIRNQLHHLYRKDLAELNFLYEKDLSLFGNDLSPTVDLINTVKQRSRHGTVLSLCDNPMPIDIMEQYLIKLSGQVDIDHLLILNWDARNLLSQRLPQWRIKYWPYFWLEQLLAPDHDRNHMPKSGRISFLSGNLRYHRLHLWHNLRQLVQDHDVVVVNSTQVDSALVNFARDIDRDPGEILDMLPWSNHIKYIDQVQQEPIRLNHLISHPAYRCVVNVAAESTARDSTLFVSEKTWKAVRSRCLLLTLGDDAMISWFTDQGFWNWQSNQDLPWQQKISCIAQVFGHDDLEQQWQDFQPQLDHNLSFFLDRSCLLAILKPALESMQDLL